MIDILLRDICLGRMMGVCNKVNADSAEYKILWAIFVGGFCK